MKSLDYRKVLSNISINKKLIAGFLIIVFATSLLGGFSYLTIGNLINTDIPVINKNEAIKAGMLELRKSEKDFQLRETTNPDFFKLGTSSYLAEFEATYQDMMDNVEYVRAYGEKQNLDSVIQNTEDIEGALNEYRTTFLAYVIKVREKGFQDYGLEGELRTAVHDIEGEIDTLDGAEDLQILMLTMRRHEKDYLLRLDDSYITKLDATVTEFKTSVQNSEYSAETKTALLEHADTYQSKFHALAAMNTVIGKSSDEGLQGDYRDAIHKLEPLVQSSTVEFLDGTKSAMNDIILAITLTAAFGVVLGVVISRDITKPLMAVVDDAQIIAQGNLGHQFSVEDRQDEIGKMISAVKNMVQNTANLVGNVTNAANVVVSMSQELSSTAQQANASMEQVSSATQQIAQGAAQLSTLAQESSGHASQLSAVLQQTGANSAKAGESIQQIMKAMETTTDTVESMDISLEEIGKLANIVTDVANQTQLLALNAAIEAARAGEAGRGFAVVADAVRELSEQTNQAAEDTLKSVSDVQKNGKDAITVARSSTSEAAGGVEVINQTITGVSQGVSSVASVVKAIDEIASIAEEAASSAEENTAAAEEQTAAMSQLANNAASLEEIAASLQAELSKFNISGMHSTQNCWEILNCGRAPGGNKVKEFGVCPAATDKTSTGKNNGMNAGRYCWKVAGTFCKGEVQGNWADKMANCQSCAVYKRVQMEEGSKFQV